MRMNRVLFRNRELGVLAFVALATFLTLSVTRASGSSSAGPQRPRPQKKVAAPKRPRVDYTKFSHQTHAVAQKLACSSCHKVPAKNWKEVRKGDAAFPDVSDFPEHAACLTCHREQFFARERPAPAICSNCHVN